MTPTDIAAIEARLSAATPGPWFHDLQFLQVAAPDPRGGSCRYITAEGGPTDPDADFIANAPTDIADLLAEVRRLTARVAELEEAARWRPAREAVPSAEPVAITLYVMGIPTRSEGRKTGPNNWKTPHGSRYDADILGWRPLGPGPVAP